MGTVVPVGDNYYAALNAAVFTDGSFVYIPKGVRCPMELSTYFRINERNTGQFERTLIIAAEKIPMFLILKGVQLPNVMKTNFMLLSLSLLPLKMQRLNILQYKTGTLAIKMERVVFIIL